MNKICSEFYQCIDDMYASNKIIEVERICKRYFKLLKVKDFHYEWQPFNIASNANKIVLGNCEPALIKRCDKHNSDKMQNASFMQKPLKWKFDADSIPKNRKNNIIGGAIILMRGAINSQAKLYTFYRKTTCTDHTVLPLLENWAMHMHNQIESIHTRNYLQTPLTNREKGILRLTIVGKTASEVSAIIGIEVATVNFHLTNLRRKFNVFNKTHLISKALCMNLGKASASAQSLN